VTVTSVAARVAVFGLGRSKELVSLQLVLLFMSVRLFNFGRLKELT
jgi:hypothetical protein